MSGENGRARGRARRVMARLQEEDGRCSPSGILQGLTIHGSSSPVSPASDFDTAADDQAEEGEEVEGDRDIRGEDRDVRCPRPPRLRPVQDEQVDSRNGRAKKGTIGQPVLLRANFFDVKRTASWGLFQHHVAFEPKVERVKFKKFLLKQNSTKLPAYIFDGASLFTTDKIQALELDACVKDESNVETTYHIKIKPNVQDLGPFDAMYMQFYNIMARMCLQAVGHVLLGRNFFTPKMAVPIHKHNLELWPGFLATFGQYDRGVLYSVQSLHKVIRRDNVFNQITYIRKEILEIKGGNMDQVKEQVKAELIGTTVITRYNNRTYRIDDVAFNERATSTFDCKGQQTTYIDYYKTRYNELITSPNQPLLVSNPKKADVRRGQTKPMFLVPELCYLTGLTDQMRQNFGLMKDMAIYMFQPPHQKVETITNFVQSLRQSPKVQEELKNWGLDIQGGLVEIEGRKLADQKILFKDRQNAICQYQADNKADFTRALRERCMYSVVPMETWCCIVPERDQRNLNGLFDSMRTASQNIGFAMRRPEVVTIPNSQIQSYIDAIKAALSRSKGNLQIIMTIIPPNNKVEIYSAIKKLCYVDYGISSQCFLGKNLTNKGLLSIATKLVVQMNCKLGGEAWSMAIPVKNRMMIVGFDVHHAGVGSSASAPSIGAIVATTNDSYGRYYSAITINKNRQEITQNVGNLLCKCILAYKKYNEGHLPEVIMFYRDGVGEGQLYSVFKDELDGMRALIKETYANNNVQLPKFTFFVVTKRTVGKLFSYDPNRRSYDNPPPGTVVDDSITSPNRQDFYLIGHNARQGTVSPTSYNIIADDQFLDAGKLQLLTYKLCHMYFNWSGTVAVPAPCQYAHKLAFLTGTATQAECHENLLNSLYFL